jgi:predicted unusual protein kinase regulating ubiquinone biosynthesis (AarF/ABC1/UbiB family)
VRRDKDDLVTSAFRRFVKLGGLAGRVGSSVLAERLADLGRSAPEKETRKSENLVKNAARVVETLGRLKGGAMKVGQMLSLHVGLLPPEVAAVLKTLQQQAPRVPFEVMEGEVKSQLPDYDELFAWLEPRAFAAASIGQVHQAVLRDGRRAAVKIQYPEIERILRADLANLRVVLQGLFSLFSKVDFEPVWNELRDRLLEELDYTREAENTRRMAELHAGVPEIVIPAVIAEASTRRVLTMEYRQGISPDDACSAKYPQELKDRWGVALFELGYRGFFVHRFLHADPNLANFSFLDDGRVIVYDFGCVKSVPEELAAGYAAVVRAALDGRKSEIPGILAGMGIAKTGGEPLPRTMVDPYVEIFGEVLRPDPPYTFGEDRDFYQKMIELGSANMGEARDVRFPQDVVFVNRTLSGHFGNLTRLAATGPWRELALEYVTAQGQR